MEHVLPWYESLVTIFMKRCDSTGKLMTDSSGKQVYYPFAMPEPSTYTASTETVVDSSRNVSGYMVGQVVRNDVAKIAMSWNYISAEVLSAVMRCFKEGEVIQLGNGLYVKGSFTNVIRYYDFTYGRYDDGRETGREFYRGNPKATMASRAGEGREIRGFTGFSLSLIEV